MSCIITRKSRASIRGKLHHCQTYMRHFSHRRKYTACSSRDSFAYSESCHDSYPQFPRSSPGTRGLQTRSKKKQTTAFLESPSAKASSTNQRTFGSVDGDFLKSDRTKNTRKMLRYLSGLIYYSNTIFGNICRKNEVISHYCALKSHGAQDEFRTFASAHARYLVIFTETCK